MTDEKLIEEACEAMHDAYEAAAVREGWETQERSRRPWADVPEANKRTMRTAVAAALAVFEKAHTPTDDEREALADWLRAGAPFDSETWGQYQDQLDNAATAIEAVHTPHYERGDLIGAASAAFKARGGAPEWEEDAIARDLIIRWHLRGFEDGEKFGRRTVVPEPRAEDERIEAWHYVADHEAFKACYDGEQPLIDSVLARITQLHELEATVNELAPAPEQSEPSDAPSLITRVGWLRQSTERERLDVPFNGEVARAARLAVLDDVIAALRAAGVGGAR